MSDRGIKKWAPYKALVEQGYALNDLMSSKEKMDKPHISSDKAEEINDILVNYHNQEVIISYWRNGYLYKEKTTINIDAFNRKITLININKNISFNELTNLENTN